MSKNLFLELFNNPLMKTEEVKRFSGVAQNSVELLSNHITDVCSLSYMIGRRLIVLGQDINLGLLLERCVVHDMDEVLVGDIPRLTKYATKACHDELNKIADIAAQGISKNIDGTDYTYQLWKDSKDDTVEGFILKIADILSVTKKTIHEIDFSGNINFLHVAREASLYVGDLSRETQVREGLSDESKKYLSKLLTDSSEALEKLIEENRDKAESYEILGNEITNYLLDHRHIEGENQ